MLVTRDARQAMVIDNIGLHKVRCYIDIIMGFGKTYVAILLIQKCLIKTPKLSTLIIVPTEGLQIQWINTLKSYGINNFRVIVINTIALSESIIECDLCIIDEGHIGLRTDKFGSIYKKVKCRGLVPMSGTWSAEDKKQLQLMGLPCADKITEKEAIANKWIAERKEYCLEVELSEKNRELYNKLSEQIDATFAYFGHNWNDMISCLNLTASCKYIVLNNLIFKDINGNVLDTYKAGRFLSQKANIYMQVLKQRNELIYNSTEKLEKVTEILNSSDFKAITFGYNTASADVLATTVNNSIAYHNKIKGGVFENDLLSKYNFPIKSKGSTTKLSKDNTLKLTLQRLVNNEFTSIHTVKAADVGLDVIGMNCAIVYARVRSKEKQNQRLARSSRYEGESKLALFIHVVLKDTQDEVWYKASTYGKFGIKTFKSVQELLNTFKNEKILRDKNLIFNQNK